MGDFCSSFFHCHLLLHHHKIVISVYVIIQSIIVSTSLNCMTISKKTEGFYKCYTTDFLIALSKGIKIFQTFSRLDCIMMSFLIAIQGNLLGAIQPEKAFAYQTKCGVRTRLEIFRNLVVPAALIRITKKFISNLCPEN
jgi:hypothetical protein